MYEFTAQQLKTIHDMLAVSPFVRIAYRWYHGMTVNDEVDTNDVEDWVMAFYTAYNEIYPGTY